ncbi:MAG: hypothetical protein ACM3UP_01505 [Methanocella sp.]
MRYEIRLAGRLPANWTDWWGDFDCTVLENGDTVLTGTVSDQAALMGLLNAMCQLNLTLLSVRLLD